MTRPLLYHGRHQDNFFEGWYYKTVSSRGNTIAFIPGIVKGRDPHCFIQVLMSDNHRPHYHRFPAGAFSVRDDPFEVIIDRSRFSLSEIVININNNKQSINGSLKLNNMHRWPREELSPGVMGPFLFIPFLECYHGVISMDHTVKGALTIDGTYHDFTSRGYMEKDWGNSFPNRWIWMQTNNFKQERVSLFLSIATIPRMGREFTGLISGLLINNKLYRFATYTGARIRHLYAGKSDIRIILQDKQYKMEIRAERPRGGSLKSPISGNMEGRVNESVNADIRVKLITRQGFPIFSGRGRNAGLEVEW